MGDQLRFVSYEPKRVQKTDRIDQQVECQQCHELFETAQALRDHVGHYLVSMSRASRHCC
jgi:hypothetical protein